MAPGACGWRPGGPWSRHARPTLRGDHVGRVEVGEPLQDDVRELVRARRRRARASLGTRTTVIPAARAARTPLSESSTTRQSAGSAPSRRAASRYTSGAGLPCATSSDETTISNSVGKAGRRERGIDDRPVGRRGDRDRVVRGDPSGGLDRAVDGRGALPAIALDDAVDDRPLDRLGRQVEVGGGRA